MSSAILRDVRRHIHLGVATLATMLVLGIVLTILAPRIMRHWEPANQARDPAR